MTEHPAAFQSAFLGRPMGRLGIVGFGVYFLVLAVVAFELLVGVWPRPGATPSVRIVGGLLTVPISTDSEVRLALVALVSGALGAFVHSATSFTTYLGNRQLIRSWAVWYIVRPFIGMALALLFYYIVRAGFVAPGANGADVNPFGIAAVGGLAGMFSKEATAKLRALFEELFKPPAKDDAARADKLRPGPDAGVVGGEGDTE